MNIQTVKFTVDITVEIEWEPPTEGLQPEFLADMVVPNLQVDHENFFPEEEGVWKVIDRQIVTWEDLSNE